MRVGLIQPRYVVERQDDNEWHQFVISANRCDGSNLIDSHSSPPGRYLAEVILRVLARPSRGSSSPLVIFNPLLLLNAAHVCAVVEHLESTQRATAFNVVADKAGIPLAYQLPGTLTVEEARFFLLLSCVDAAADEALLTACFGATSTRKLSFRVSVLTNGFAGGSHLKPCLWMTAHATRCLTKLRASLTSADEFERRKKLLRFSAFMPHHAGDVLLFAIASRGTPDWFDELVVNEAYAAIPAAAECRFTIKAISAPPPYREENDLDDPGYFAQVVPELSADKLYVYLRTNRYYSVTDFHLIDHFAFALGRHYTDKSDFLANEPVASWALRPRPDNLVRVLLHFDAGWPLKRYPADYQRRLAEHLRQMGLSLTVLDRGVAGLNARYRAFQDLEAFTHLVKEHDLVIGMDSFPAHYASRIGGLPTLVLFSNTHWVNHEVPGMALYRKLDEGLSCCPCIARTVCPRFGGAACRNFSPPETVAGAVSEILRAAIGRSSESRSAARCEDGSSRLPSAAQPGYLRPTRRITNLAARQTAAGRYLNLLRCHALAWMAPGIKLWTLAREYVRSCLDQGLWLGNHLVMQFVLRALRARKVRRNTALETQIGEN